ncbi:sigma-70 family RNA polymerase sigma factor [Mucilaginibacter sp. KACC 22063]|uniref:sigma-70 family RNA polymerase sigma factor n=1 Tax=Mucilaginibacter sp. KACC 22063 TaxID=3025666 RepID=UPI002365CCE3|nr:RNA polymerase sigma factor RpoD/SigA [Mucilaginibacter sp. KACC 22063]WDF55646.1 RNA polymerase sigma factor RpoD/SigA [Mucilaginibacter sp. KACC 22063]
MRQLKISESITNRETASLNQYLSDIAKIPMVTAQEEVILAQKIREGDEAALQRLTTANLRFVVSVAKQYQSSGLTLGDLINEGNVGLVKAAKRFDETKGFKFISYAVWWIRQSILAAIAEQSRMVRLPANQVGELSKIAKSSSRLEQVYERQPTAEELAEDLETTVDKVTTSLANSGKHISYDSPFSSEEDNTLLDVLKSVEPGTDKEMMNESLSVDVADSMKILSEKEKEVVELFFGLKNQHAHSLEEIGDKIHLTRERVRQIKDRALARLRDSRRTRSLRAYLGD